MAGAPDPRGFQGSGSGSGPRGFQGAGCRLCRGVCARACCNIRFACAAFFFLCCFSARFACLFLAVISSLSAFGFPARPGPDRRLQRLGLWVVATGHLLGSFGTVSAPRRCGRVGFWLLGVVAAAALPDLAPFMNMPLGLGSQRWVVRRIRAGFRVRGRGRIRAGFRAPVAACVVEFVRARVAICGLPVPHSSSSVVFRPGLGACSW